MGTFKFQCWGSNVPFKEKERGYKGFFDRNKAAKCGDLLIPLFQGKLLQFNPIAL